MTENAFLIAAVVTAGASWTTVRVVRMALAYRTSRRRDQVKIPPTVIPGPRP